MVRRMQETVPYKIVKADNGDAWVEVLGNKDVRRHKFPLKF